MTASMKIARDDAIYADAGKAMDSPYTFKSKVWSFGHKRRMISISKAVRTQKMNAAKKTKNT